jgi:hypothetical protein
LSYLKKSYEAARTPTSESREERGIPRPDSVPSRSDLSSNTVSSMPFDEFKRSCLAVRVWSKLLKREIWFVSNEDAAREIGIDGILFTGEELKLLTQRKPSVEELQAIMEIKGVLRGSVIESSENDNRNRGR